MSFINQQHLDFIFAPLANYGSRGNSALWSKLYGALNQQEFAMSAQQLVQWVCNYTQENIVSSVLKQWEQGEVNYNNEAVFKNASFYSHFAEKGNHSPSIDSITPEELGPWLNGWVHNILSTAGSYDTLYVEAFNHGGMSGGGFCMETWQTRMLPTLIQRCEQLDQGLEFAIKHKCDDVYFIGDVHGRLDKLQALLEEIHWSANSEKLIFVGDLIDNNPTENADHLALLENVKAKVDNGDAFCLLGNHELNAIGWLLRKPNGDFCRPHTDKNRLQHQLFLEQVGEGSAEHEHWVSWFKSLPLFLNFGSITAIHACWHQASIQKLRPYLNDDNSLKSEYWLAAFDEQHELFQLLEILLKSPELELPEGYSFKDKSGTARNAIRVAWWKDEYSVRNYRELAVVACDQKARIPGLRLNRNDLKFNLQPLVPVVVGHYTLATTQFTEQLSPYVACVDFNAAKAENPLVALYANVEHWPDSLTDVLADDKWVFAGKQEPDVVVDLGIQEILKATVQACTEVVEHGGFLQYVEDTLYYRWDPIGVYDPDGDDSSLQDEYDAYAADVMRIAQSGNVGQLAGYLQLVEQFLIRIERDNSRYICTKVSHNLVERWQQESMSHC